MPQEMGTRVDWVVETRTAIAAKKAEAMRLRKELEAVYVELESLRLQLPGPAHLIRIEI